MVNLHAISGNPKLFGILDMLEKKYYDRKIDWLDELDWDSLSQNPHPTAIDLLKSNPKQIDYDSLSQNPNPNAQELLYKKPSKINWEKLRVPPSDSFLQKNMRFINWEKVAFNENEWVVKMFENQPEKNHRNLFNIPKRNRTNYNLSSKFLTTENVNQVPSFNSKKKGDLD